MNWRDSVCFVVGGGPSLRDFPWDRLWLLEDEKVIAVNRAFRQVSWAHVCYIGDSRNLEALADDMEWKRFEGMKLVRAPHLDRAEKGYEDCWPLRVCEHWGRSLREGVIHRGCAGAAALNLADILGADPIYLLGFDCKASPGENLMDNFHDEYPRVWRKATPLLEEKFRAAIEPFANDIRAKVINLGPDSALECFEKQDWREVL